MNPPGLKVVQVEKPRARRRILVIDDEAMMRDLLTLHLGRHGYDVVAVADAVIGGHMILSDPPELIISDVDMPYMTGYEFVSALKSDPTTRHIPVVFLTTDDNVAEQARKLGASAYLNKPVRADRLLEVVAILCP